jgi:hypothetical protein
MMLRRLVDYPNIQPDSQAYSTALFKVIRPTVRPPTQHPQSSLASLPAV